MAVNWLKTGADSAKIAQQEEANAQAYKEGKGKLFRFYLKDKEEAKITFIDGDLSPEGLLLPPRYYEHSLAINGKWGNFFVCPEKTQPDAGYKCPICESGERPSLVALFTIIDHRVQKSKDGQKVYKDQKRLLVAKTVTMEMLTKIAIKRGGLAGCTFDVTRMGDTSASVGSMFDFGEKNDVTFLRSQFTKETEDPVTKAKKQETYFEAANYEDEVVFRTPDELLKMGMGSKSFSGPALSPGGANPITKSQYADKL